MSSPLNVVFKSKKQLQAHTNCLKWKGTIVIDNRMRKRKKDREIPISLKISKKVCVYLTRGIDTTVALKQIFSLGIKKW